jgi:hypothetical protein
MVFSQAMNLISYDCAMLGTRYWCRRDTGRRGALARNGCPGPQITIVMVMSSTYFLHGAEGIEYCLPIRLVCAVELIDDLALRTVVPSSRLFRGLRADRCAGTSYRCGRNACQQAAAGQMQR